MKDTKKSKVVKKCYFLLFRNTKAKYGYFSISQWPRCQIRVLHYSK